MEGFLPTPLLSEESSRHMAPPASAATSVAMQHSLARSTACAGIGLHSGKKVRMDIRPAPADHGIVFIRTDVAAGTGVIPARYDLVTDTRLCSLLRNAHGVTLGTVEHIMAALAGAQIDNAEIHVDGPEIPIMDGSSAIFMEMFESAGRVASATPRRAIQLRRAVRVEEGDKWASYTPAPLATFAFTIEFAAAAIGAQRVEFTQSPDSFAHELASARTFCLLAEVEQMRKMGLAQGGSLENAVVVDGETILNADGLRCPDEFVRHKLLDAVGDLYLAGAPIIGAYASHKGGHALNNRLLRAIFANSTNWEFV